MNMIYRLFFLCLICLLSLNRGVSQVTKVKLQLAYDTMYCWYDVKLIIIEGSASSPTNRVQFNSSITIVVPTGTTINLDGNSEVDSLYMPLVNNLAYNGTNPMLWILNSSSISPTAQPQNDFYQFVPSLSPICRYNNLAASAHAR